MKKEWKYFIYTAILMVIFSIIFKTIPMKIFGKDILFDASRHVMTAILALYAIYIPIKQNESWRVPFFILSAAILMVISFQRIQVNAHNDIGLLLGLGLTIISIIIPLWNEFKKRLKF